MLGGVAAWPLAGHAQQGQRVRRVGVLMLTSSDEPESQTNIAAFLQGLQEAGWAVGRNLRIDYRWSGNDRTRLNQHATELISLGPDVRIPTIVTTRSDGSRPPVPIDRDQCDGAVRCIC